MIIENLFKRKRMYKKEIKIDVCQRLLFMRETSGRNPPQLKNAATSRLSKNQAFTCKGTTRNSNGARDALVAKC